MTFLKFIFAMFFAFLPGILGVIVTPMDTGGNIWYTSLNNSVLTPAGWVFSVVWTLLYFLLGLALFFIMQKNNINEHYNKKSAYILFAVNMVLNTLWSFAFFGLQYPELALLLLTAMIITAIFMLRSFYQVSKAAFWLVVPYIVWLMFAFYLNGMIIYLN